ncbi:hypothetical protein BB776_02060 [Planococcus salinarum]|uniref:DNA primase n=1 Tax=Planococcus salinarum TaxID=622695 RepID=A0ABX3D0X1_9BACL|nr:hypothetical protein [Planococcus salinarum]OHX52683.1 hypothetical protein BB776_02060 [Planococcus salinarum]
MKNSQMLIKLGLTFSLSLGLLGACNTGDELEEEIEEEELEDAIEEDTVEPVDELEEEIEEEGLDDAVEDEDLDINEDEE